MMVDVDGAVGFSTGRGQVSSPGQLTGRPEGKTFVLPHQQSNAARQTWLPVFGVSRAVG